MPVEFSEYKGNKLIVLRRNPQDKYPFQFGKSKARLIVENYDDIKKFADEQDAPKPATKKPMNDDEEE